jgi:hypothetical protein
MSRRRRVLVQAVACMMIAPAAIACEPTPIGTDAARIEGENFVLVWRVEPGPLRLGEFFTVILSACEKRAQAVSGLKVDASMPAHKHGMNYLPSITIEGGGRFVASGLLLHMPGRWEFAFDVSSGTVRESLRTNVDLR